VGRTGDVDLWKVEARLTLALGCSPEGLLIAFDSGWYRETARSTCFLSWGSRLQLSINARTRELPYTFVFRYALAGYLVALRWMAVAGAKNVKPEKIRNDIVDGPLLRTRLIFRAFFKRYEGERDL
jgi:hypothetical protein